MATNSNIKSVNFDDFNKGESITLLSSKIDYVNNEHQKLFLSCSICLCPSIDPILCLNEHMFCRTCIQKNSEYRNTCPECNIDTDLTKYIPAVRPIQNILDNLEVYCLYKHNGCTGKMTRKELSEHIKVCEHTNKKCQISILNPEGEMIKCDMVYCIDEEDKHNHCLHSEDGCLYIGTKTEEHEKVCHFKLISPFFNKVLKKITHLEKRQQILLDHVNGKLTDMENTVDASMSDLQNITKAQSVSLSKFDNYVIDHVNAKISKLETTVSASMSDLQNITKVQTVSLSEFDNYVKAHDKTLNTVLTNNEALNKLITELQEKVNKLQLPETPVIAEVKI